METDSAVYLVAGVGLFLAGALPLLRFRGVSTAMGFVATGVVAGLLPVPLPDVLPASNRELIERLTEVAIIVALMGAGLAIDRRPGWRAWSSTWRLLGITMPLCIAAVAALGWGLMGLAPAAALLLGAALAPTDPVLAADVRVEGPNADDEEDVVRHALTTEAGVNDGLAFPFVYAAIFLLTAELTTGELAVEVGRWFAWDLVGRTAIAVLLGVVVGRLFAMLAFKSRTRWLRLAEVNEGILALAATFASYGAAEALHGWGFVAVFVTGLSIRGYRREADYHEELHRFTHQVERLLTLAALLMFGVACATGLLASLTWEGLLVAALLVLVIRPVTGALALVRAPGTWPERLAKAFFGVRGIGSFYYLAYAFGQAPFVEKELLWSTVAAAVLLSVALHGATATVAMQRLDRRREADA
ncbi:MAG TPA: cation:proton antiporter [Nocardioides sp.]|nr:cation:proton antiporter [Nocardioides sp.]